MNLSIKRKIKGAPTLALKVFSIRSRRMIESEARELGLDRLAREVSLATGSTVAAGPFAGIRLDYELFPVHASPKFLGTYEQELHSVIERAIQLDPTYVLILVVPRVFTPLGWQCD